MIPLHLYPHVPCSYTICHAMEEMERSQIDFGGRTSLPRSLLIFDELNKLMGIARRRDLLRGLEPKFMFGPPKEYRKKLFNIKVDPNLAEMVFDRMTIEIAHKAERPLLEIMTPIEHTVDFDDHVVKAIEEMVTNDLDLLPVMKLGKVVGVLRTVEAMHEMRNMITEGAEEAKKQTKKNTKPDRATG
jgi:CBS-domain-containing membrane protein